MTGFVGANGAGKTTAMRIILGVLDAGRRTDPARRCRPRSAPDRRRFGYMPEERGLYPKMRVAEQIVYLARLHGMTHADATPRTPRGCSSGSGSASARTTTVESLSLGNQQRAQIAAALVHDPDVLVLDEPFSGLDPLAVESVQAVLKEHAADGACVLFSSHQLDIVERLCDDLVVIAGGVIRASGLAAVAAAPPTHRPSTNWSSPATPSGCGRPPASPCCSGRRRHVPCSTPRARMPPRRCCARPSRGGRSPDSRRRSLARADLPGGHPVTHAAATSTRRASSHSVRLVAGREVG